MEGARLEGPVTLVTRVRPPQVRRDLVSRPRLLDLLESDAGRRVTLVSAPAGFGKTTLLAEWASTTGRPVAWLTLDEEDSDPATFWGDVAESLGHAVPGFRPAGPGALGELRRPVALVLDGYEQVAGESVARLVGEAPPMLRIVLSGRVDPSFPLEELRARGEVLEIGAGDLRMTDVEAAELLHRLAGGSLAVRRLRSAPVLSERELEVLRLLASGLAKREIGSELYLSFNEVHSHTKAIYRKLGVSSRHEAVVRAHELGVAQTQAALSTMQPEARYPLAAGSAAGHAAAVNAPSHLISHEETV